VGRLEVQVHHRASGDHVEYPHDAPIAKLCAARRGRACRIYDCISSVEPGEREPEPLLYELLVPNTKPHITTRGNTDKSPTLR
jgi:hypothetical protein